MITRIKNTAFVPLITLAVITIFFSCQKENSQSSSSSESSSSTIAVAASATELNSAGAADSVYIIQPCPHGYSRDSITESQLPSAATAYLSANYSGYTFNKAFAIVNNSGQTAAYVSIIYDNDKPVAILFDSSGNFVKILEQREKGDLDGRGWHDGGRFCDRDGLHRDTIALSTLPSAITSYFATNYPSDTLIKAFQSRDSNIVVLSKNNGVYATVFTSDGTFVKRDQLPTEQGTIQSIDLAALPSIAANYLSLTYPNYVFEKAFSFSLNGPVKGYVVVIDANNTKYAVEFDGSGNFLRAKTIH